MAPTKESDIVSPAPEKRVVRAEDAGRPQPVALEVPVTVNGARTIEGSDKREPFSESTQTVLVFGNGAVLRLASAVAPGQLLFLTHEKTKKEVVCQVVKSKNYRNVTGYVELEFTEAMPGFWGMRFPNERAAQPAVPAVPAPPASGPSAAPVVAAPIISPISPVVARATPPAAIVTPKAPEAKIVPPAVAPAKHEGLTTDALKTQALKSASLNTESKPPAVLTLPRTPDSKAAQPQLKISVPTEPSWTSSISRAPEVKPPAPIAIKSEHAHVAPVSISPAKTPSVDAALLEQQLSELFSAPEPKTKMPSTVAMPVAPSAPGAPVAKKPSVADLTSKVIQIAKSDVSNAKTAPVKSAPSSLDVEEVKIPSWLEPLARNAAHTAQENTAKHESSEVEEANETPSVETASIAPSQDVPASPAVELHSHHFPVQQSTLSVAAAPASGNKGIVIGAIAAGILLLVGGGAWFARRPAAQAATPSVTTSVPAASQSAAVPAQAQSAAPAVGLSAPRSSAVISGSDATSQGNTPTALAASQPVRSAEKSYAAQELAAYKKLAEPEAKKPTIGEVHLASPTVSRGAVRADNGADSAPSLADTQTPRDSSGAGLMASNSIQPEAPTAPLPVGGDVHSAYLISSVPPVYPVLAKNQRIAGEVRLDALIDATGKVSAMKVISGPTLLQQAAKDSLRQWKYHPATLNGDSIPMHLTVTIQFHLQ
jgi:TonB family protein